MILFEYLHGFDRLCSFMGNVHHYIAHQANADNSYRLVLALIIYLKPSVHGWALYLANLRVEELFDWEKTRPTVKAMRINSRT